MMEQNSLEDDQSADPGAFMKATIKSINFKFPTVKNITTTILEKWLKSPNERKVILLDSRPEEEYIISHIEGSKRVDFTKEDVSSLSMEIDEEFRGKPNPTIVCYCSVGYRSSVMAKRLQEHYSKQEHQKAPEIYNLAGSIFQWANEHRPMIDANGQKTIFAHPYSAVWGKLLDKSLRKSNL